MFVDAIWNALKKAASPFLGLLQAPATECTSRSISLRSARGGHTRKVRVIATASGWRLGVPQCLNESTIIETLRKASRVAIGRTTTLKLGKCAHLGLIVTFVGAFGFVPLGLTHLAHGESLVGGLALSVPVLCMFFLFLFAANNRNDVRVIAYVFIYVVAIVAIHFGLGGLRQSGGIIIWILIAPPLIMMGHRPHTGIQCAIMVSALIGFLLIADPWISQRSHFSTPTVFRLVAVNMAGFALFIWSAVGFYVWRNELQNRSITSLAVANERAQSALFDSLTNIPNREGAKQVCPTSFPLTVLVIDLDRFKAVNTALGRSLGDQVLVLFAKQLSTLPFVSLGRLHADRFVMLRSDDLNEVEIDTLIGGVLDAPLEIDGQVIDLSATVGLARCASAADLELTMRNAETAMTTARRRHRRCLEYTPEMLRHRRSDLSLMSDLNQAIAKNELRMYLQPKVLLRDGTVASAEALIRWQHPVRGMVPPMDFIPFAEQTGRIRLLTNWILREAMLASVMRRERGGQLQISVNVCAADLADPNFEASVLQLATETRVVVEDIRFEVTESGLMEQPELAFSVMKRLQALGFTWSIDDFGTGYSSLSHLQKIPVAELKIDRAFIKGLGGALHNSKLLRSAIRMGHDLGLTVVCEGAETSGEWRGLIDLGADYGQGWFASRPIPADEFDAWCRLHVPFDRPPPVVPTIALCRTRTARGHMLLPEDT